MIRFAIDNGHKMRLSGKSPEGFVAFVHFASLIITGLVFINYMPIRESTTLQSAIYNFAGSIISVLVFPIGYAAWFFPKPSKPADFGIGFFPMVLMPINSCLWGYFIVRAWRTCFVTPINTQADEYQK